VNATLVHAAVFAALAGGATLARQAAEQGATEGLPDRVRALPALPVLEVAATGYRAAAADIAWLQAVQYYGEHREGGNDLQEFEHFVAAVNTLDPRFEHAHVFGAVVVATEKRDLEGALDILRRGARANPASPQCPFEMGFLTYVQGGDLDAAIAYLRIAVQRPGGRERAQRFIAFLNRKLGRLETAWLLWADLYQTTRDPGMRIVAGESMRKLEKAIRAQRAAGTPPVPGASAAPAEGRVPLGPDDMP
jgi:tetratricopeptide (TPR) repeat protein